MKKNILLLLILLLLTKELISENTIKWERLIQNGEGFDFVGISKADNQFIMAFDDIEGDIGPQREILKSTDGGKSWKSVYLDANITWHISMNICYPTRNFCIATCDSNYYLKSTDGGKTWAEHRIDIPYYTNGLVHISLLDSNFGVMGSYNNIVYSDNGFKTYRVINLPKKLLYGAIKLISPTKIYMFENSPGNFYQYDVTSDKWTEYPTNFQDYVPGYRTPYNMYFADSLYGFVVGLRNYTQTSSSSYDMIHKTTDGGKTWVEKLNIYNHPAFGLFYVDFCDRENGIAVGQDAKIYWTHDSGNTWAKDSQPDMQKGGPPVLHVVMTGKYSAVIANFIGEIWITPPATEIVENRNNMDIPVYPNPTDSYIYINLPSEFLTEKIKIYSVEGILVYQTSDILKMSDVSAKIDVSRFSAGVYYVKVGDRVCRFLKM